ncbi:hypothetical protein Tco_0004253 [Tanacetum coccineum]
MMVVKEIVSRLLEEVEKLEWWFDQDIDDEGEEDEEGKGGSERRERSSGEEHSRIGVSLLRAGTKTVEQGLRQSGGTKTGSEQRDKNQGGEERVILG